MIRAAILGLIFVASIAGAQVVPQQTRSSTGQPVVRFYNNTSQIVSCYYRDRYNYHTFSIKPYTHSIWFPVYGNYQWSCKIIK